MMDGEIMEISGLAQEAPKPASGNGFPWGSLIFLAASFGVGYWLGMKGTFGKLLSGLDGLGILKPCRKKDLRAGRRKSSQKWCLWDSKGKRILGRHSSERKGRRQERLIQMKKHGR